MSPSMSPRLRFIVRHESSQSCVPPDQRLCKGCGGKLERAADDATLLDLCPPCAERIHTAHLG